MSRELLLVRHGKAEWDNPQGDAERVLSQAGMAEAAAVGQWLGELQICPDRVLCSTAQRTRQTWANIAMSAHCNDLAVQFEPLLYLAEADQLLTMLSAIPVSYHRVMLVGHNPAIEKLATYLVDRPLPRNTIGEVMATANTVYLRLPDGWQSLAKGSGELLNFFRPQPY